MRLGRVSEILTVEAINMTCDPHSRIKVLEFIDTDDRFIDMKHMRYIYIYIYIYILLHSFIFY